MHLFLNFFGISIPAYGFMIVCGLLAANLLTIGSIQKNGHDINDFILLEAFALIGAFGGAKILYITVSFRDIEWNRIFELDYFNSIMNGGFVFFGGLIGGILMVLLAGYIFKIDAYDYIKDYIYTIPLIHCFGRIGCFLAGCCYGINYEGLGAVIFPENSLAPSGIPLFPVQIVEAFCLFLIFLVLFYLTRVRHSQYTIETYILLYSILRFFIEFFRGDAERGYIWIFSTSQWISIALVIVSLIWLKYNQAKYRTVQK